MMASFRSPGRAGRTNTSLARSYVCFPVADTCLHASTRRSSTGSSDGSSSLPRTTLAAFRHGILFSMYQNGYPDRSHLPTSPGVYIFKDAQDAVIYVGKAKNIRARVDSYFTKSGDGRPKIAEL